MADEINVDNAAVIIAKKADEIINQALAWVDAAQRSLAAHLIRKEVWDRLREQMGFGASELREVADEIEAEEADTEIDAEKE